MTPVLYREIAFRLLCGEFRGDLIERKNLSSDGFDDAQRGAVPAGEDVDVPWCWQGVVQGLIAPNQAGYGAFHTTHDEDDSLIGQGFGIGEMDYLIGITGMATLALYLQI